MSTRPMPAIQSDDGESGGSGERWTWPTGAIRVASALVLAASGALVACLSLSGAEPAAAASITPTLYTTNYDASTITSYPLTATGDASPSATVSATSGSLDLPELAALDVHGDLWVPNFANSTVVEYTQEQLNATGDPVPAATMSANANSIDGPGALAFDAAGDLWVSNVANSTIVEYTPAQLANLSSDADPVPVATISANAGSIDGPNGLAFDPAGDLWVANYYGGTNAVEFTAAQLANLSSDADPVPVATISGLSSPLGLAFDAAGDLWVANYGASTLMEFPPGQQITGGSPKATISATAGSIDGPVALAFDAAGDLWVANFFNSSVVEFTPGQLVTGSPTPADTISGASTGLGFPAGLAVAEAPTVTSVSPSAGPEAGGETVTITGTGFYPGSTVDFGATPATSVTYVDPYELTAVSPAGAGTVDVTVTTFAGTSTTSAADQFDYTTLGYWEVASDGGIFAFGTAQFYGSMGGKPLNAPVVAMAATASHTGYWEAASDGGIFAFGTAQFYGSEGGKSLNAPVVGMAADPSTGGYWEVAADGGIFAFNAPFYGSEGGKALNAPIVGMVATPSGNGYWLVAKDGGVFAFGSAGFNGSMGGNSLDAPIVGIASSADGNGYWEAAADGGVFAFGSATFEGSEGGKTINGRVVGVEEATDGNGYWLVARDGGIFSFGGAPFEGSMGGKPLNAPVVGMAGS